MRPEVYRVAFDEASAELSEIITKFEQLRLRKDRIEKVIEALKPLVGVNELQNTPVERLAAAPAERTYSTPPPPTDYAPAVPPPAIEVTRSIPYPVQRAVDAANDPFSRRTEAENQSAKEVREYSRLFNTGGSR